MLGSHIGKSILRNARLNLQYPSAVAAVRSLSSLTEIEVELGPDVFTTHCKFVSFHGV